MKSRFWMLMFFLVSFATGWGQEPLCLSLKQTEDLAIRNNYQINASLHRLEQGYFGYRASKDYFRPTVSFSAEADIGKHEHSLDNALLITQPLFNQVSFYQIKESQIQWEISRLEVQQQICDILFQVREAYYTVLLNQAHLAIDQAIIQIWEEEVKRQKRHLELGATIPFELNQVNLHLKGAWIDYYSTQSDLRKSQIQLLTVLGLPSHTSFQLIENEIPLPPFDWQKCPSEQWKQWAFQFRPQLKSEQFNYLLSQNKVCQTKAERIPTVSLYGNAGHHYVYDGFDHQPYVGVGVNLDWKLYDPSIRERIKQAKEGTREATSNYYQAELEAEAEVTNLLNEIEKSFLAFQSAEEGAKLAEEGMQMATKKHQLGLMSSFEFRDSIKTLHEAQQQINQAKFDLHNAYDRLIQQTGLDLKK